MLFNPLNAAQYSSGGFLLGEEVVVHLEVLVPERVEFRFIFDRENPAGVAGFDTRGE